MSIQLEEYTPNMVTTVRQGSSTVLVDPLGEAIVSVQTGMVDESILAMEAQIQARHLQAL